MDGIKMDAESLELPSLQPPKAWKQDGMRVVVFYQINTDSFVARFDTKINGEQRNIAFDQARCHLIDSGTSAERFAQQVASYAAHSLKSGECGKGPQIFMAKYEPVV